MLSVEIVIFNAFRPGSVPAVIEGDLSGAEQINLLCLSALQADPDVRFTILTDPDTDLAAVGSAFKRIERKIDFSCIMLERTRMQEEYLRQYAFDRPVVFLDSDILVTGALGQVFEASFDVGVTWRPSDEMPFNGGAIYVNNRNPAAGQGFFSRLLEIYATRYQGTSNWYGDQFAIVSIVDLPFEDIARTPQVERDGIQIALLPCANYNFSPEGERPDLFHRNEEALIYHFKGMSRRIMKLYWTYQIAQSARSKPFRSLRMMYHNLRLSLQRRFYRRRLKRDIRRFNCHEQDQAAWINRAEIAANFVNSAATGKDADRIRIADIGCGDGKLGRILGSGSRSFEYVGYDLVPQSSEVIRFDIDKDTLPGRADIAVVLGVLEYSSDVGLAMRRLAGSCGHLIVSHAVTDLKRITPSRRRRMNWKTHLSKLEFERSLQTSGFDIIEECVTANARSLVWLCRSRVQP